MGISRQAYYQGEKARQRKVVDEAGIVELVRQERKIQPRLGGRKLLHILQAELERMSIAVGRDRFFEVLRFHDLLVQRKSRRGWTTDSRHGFRWHPNIFKDVEADGPNQAWVSDITYIRTDPGFMYLALITDAWSRKIVGYNISNSLCAEGCQRALTQAFRQLKRGEKPLHHSDRGIQYCCHDYIEMLENKGCEISMTEVNHCYENALAERVNGILKGEYLLGATFRSKKQAMAAVPEAILLYNERRPHLSLDYRTPAEVHNRRQAA